MVCSFCHKDEPRPHNVRTCEYLKAAVKTFIAYKGVTMTQDSFFESCIAYGCDIVLTGGMASVAMAMYQAYDKCTKMLDVSNIVNMSKRDQAKALLSSGYFGSAAKDQADAAAADY